MIALTKYAHDYVHLAWWEAPLWMLGICAVVAMAVDR